MGPGDLKNDTLAAGISGLIQEIKGFSNRHDLNRYEREMENWKSNVRPNILYQVA